MDFLANITQFARQHQFYLRMNIFHTFFYYIFAIGIADGSGAPCAFSIKGHAAGSVTLLIRTFLAPGFASASASVSIAVLLRFRPDLTLLVVSSAASSVVEFLRF